MPEHVGPRSRPIAVLALLAPLLSLLLPSAAAAQAPLRKIGEMELSLVGLHATVDPLEPVVPKAVASGVRIVVRAGATELTVGDLARFFGPDFAVKGELSGPGLQATVTLPDLDEGEPLPGDPLLLPLPALPVAGDYEIANLRIEKKGVPALDVTPSRIPLKVIDQILVTSVKTRPLTLDEIRARGVDLSNPDNYLGFSFAIGLKLESKVVQIEMPVVFDRQGNVVPEPLQPPPAPFRESLGLPPTIIPTLMQLEGEGDDGPRQNIDLPGSVGGTFSIPALLVIPGDVGFLKQFFSAQLFVANGAPVGSGLVVRGVTGKVQLPLGPDGVRGGDPDNCTDPEKPETCLNDDPLSLPDLVREGQSVPHPETLPVAQVGPDGTPGTEDDDPVLRPAEQGMADFTIRGEKEGFHRIDFDLRADLLGLPVGPVRIKGKASGGVLVQNAKFKLSFVAPSVVRADEEFTLNVAVTNISSNTPANLLSLTLPADQMSGLRLAPDESPRREMETLGAQETAVFEYRFVSEATGQVVASYLNFGETTPDGTSGDLRFKVAVGERGVPLSPDTLVLPTSVAGLPPDVVRAAMRVLGHAWSVANAPSGTLPKDVVRTDRSVVKEKALALAEAGLRVTLGQPVLEAVRDIGYDFWSGKPSFDQGFDQVLRQTRAGHDLAWAIGRALQTAAAATGPLDYEREMARVLASGPDFLSFAVASGSSRAPVDVMLTDGLGRSTFSVGAPFPKAAIPSAVLLPLGDPAHAPLLGLVTSPSAAPYHLTLTATETGVVDLAVTLPRGDGTVVRATVTGASFVAGERGHVILDLGRPESLVLEHDIDGDGLFERTEPLVVDASTRDPEGPALRAARVVGPRTVSSASPLGVYAALLFDRVVDPVSAGQASSYTIPKNRVLSAKPQLSGRIVFVALDLPEGNYVPTTISVQGIADTRGAVGPASGEEPLVSLVEDPGAVVTGRVLNGDGSPLPAGVVVHYLADGVSNPLYCWNTVANPVSAIEVDETGGFELRYVRQSLCGLPFELVTQDPANGAVTKVTGRVRGPGDRMVMDIALLAKGSVLGTVTSYASAGSLEKVPVPGALVRVFSATETQSYGETTTDGDGRYRVDGITVGPVSAHAAKGLGVGSGSGRIDRPGTPAVVDITLDDNALRVSGTVYKIDPNEPDPAKRTTTVPGVQVLYRLDSRLVGIAQTGADGTYAFDGMPAGVFTLEAALNTRDKATSLAMNGSRGDVLTVDLAIELPLESSPTLGTVRGRVLLADGLTPAPGVQVSVGQWGVLTVAQETPAGPPVGSFEIRGIPTEDRSGNLVHYTLLARHPDGKRTAYRSFTFAPVPSPVYEADLVLNDLGEARFVVLSPQGQPLANQEVWLQGICLNPCGCKKASTGPAGEPAVFRDLPAGNVTARSFLSAATFTDVAAATATVRGNAPGQHGEGTLRFAGVGSLSGTVFDPPQTEGVPPQPAQGVQVSVSSRVFLNDGEQTCGLVPGESHHTRSDGEGKFVFRNVPVGALSVNARHELLNQAIGRSLHLTADGQAIDGIVLQFTDTTAGIVSGLVTLPDGVTPSGPGVEVTASGPLPDATVPTNAASQYRFAEILPQGGYTLTARDPETGFTTQAKVYLRGGQDATHDLRLQGRGTVRVRVVDGAGAAVDQAVVRLTETDYPSGSYETILSPASAGLATFSRVFEGGFAVEVSDRYGRGGRASGILPGPGAAVDVEVRVTTTGTLTGRFRMPDPDGAPIPLGSVTLLAGGRAIGRTTTATTGDVGRYTFDHVPAGSIRVEAQDPLTGRTGFNVGTLETEGQTLELDVTAQAIGRVVGKVTLNDVGVPQARVEVVSGSFKATTYADEDGDYALPGVPEGRVVVTATRSGGDLAGTASATLSVEGKDVTINVSLRDTGRLYGAVRAAGGGTAPLSVVKVQVGGQGGGTLETVTRPEDGFYEFPQVPAGVATLTVDTLASIDRATATVEVPARGEVQQDVELNGVGAIQATVVDVPAGYDTRVTLTGTGSFPYSIGAVPYPQPNGTFLLPEVLAGPFTATLRTSNGPLPLAGLLSDTLVPGETKQFVLRVQPTGRVHGTVVRPDGRPAFGADVTVVTRAGTLATVVREDGQFSLSGVPQRDLADPADQGLGIRVHDTLTDGRAFLPGLTLAGDSLDVGEILIDAGAPTLTLVHPAPGSTVRPFAGPIVIRAQDASGIDTATLRVTYQRTRFTHSLWDFAWVDGEFRGTLYTPAVAPGANDMVVTLADQAGNTARLEASWTVLGGTIRGVVHDALGQPRGGVSVSAGGATTTSAGETGVFEFTGVRPGNYSVVATDPDTGLAAPGRPVSLADGGEEDVGTIPLPAYGWIEGTVVRRIDTMPFEGVAVTGAGGGAVTDVDGFYRIGPVALGSTTLAFGHPPTGDRAQRTVTLTVHNATVRVDVTMNGVGSLVVTVRQATGAVAGGAGVTVTATSPPFTETARADTGPSGEPASFPKVLAGAVEIAASWNGLAGSETISLADRESRSLTIALQAAGRIAGTIVGQPSSILAGADVQLLPQNRHATANPSGDFVFENVPAGEVQLKVETTEGDRGSWAGTVPADGTAQPQIALNGLGTVVVTVKDPLGAQVDGADVRLTTLRFGFTYPLRKTQDGTVTFTAVLAGDVKATATHPTNGIQGEATGTLGVAGTATLEITLAPVGRVTGRVVPAAAGPATADEVWLGNRKTTPAPGGAFAFEDVRLGTYRLEARRGGRVRARIDGVQLNANGDTVTQDLALVPTATVHVTVEDGSGTGVSAASVALDSTGPFGAEPFTATTDGAGEAAIADVAPGAFEVHATKGDDRGDGAGAVPPEGGDVAVTVPLVSSAVTIPSYGLTFADANGLSWGVRADGSVVHGSMLPSSAPSPRLHVVHEGQAHAFTGPECASSCLVPTEEAFREVVLRQSGLAGLDVTRKVFVPVDGYFLRHLDLLRNPGPGPVTVDLVAEIELGSATASVIGSSSGDATADASDRWLALDDADATDIWSTSNANWAFAPLGLAFAGPGGLAPGAVTVESTASGARWLVTRRWDAVTIGPGETVALLQAFSGQSDRARALASAERLAQLPPELFAGLSPEERAAVRNFAVPGSSALAPLPPLDGVVLGEALAGDAETRFAPNQQVHFRSRSPYYGQPLAVSAGADGSFAVRGSPASSPVKAVPRAPFDLASAHETNLGRVTTAAEGAFATTGTLDLATLTGRVLRASSSWPGAGYLPERATDGDPGTYWMSESGDSALRGRSPWIEVALPADATVRTVLVRGRADGYSHVLTARVEVFDLAGALLHAADLPLAAGGGELMVPEGADGGRARRVRVTSLLDASAQVAFAELQVQGEADAGPAGQARSDLVFRGTGVLDGDVVRADGSAVVNAAVRLKQGTSSLNGTISGTNRFAFVAVPPGTYELVADHPLGDHSVAVPGVTLPGPCSGDPGAEVCQKVTQRIAFAAFGGVAGRVTTSTGLGLNAHVVLGDGAGFSRQVFTSNGDFRFADVPPGAYTVTATDSQRSGAQVSTPVQVEAGSDAPASLTFPVVAPVTVEARVAGQALYFGAVHWWSESRPEWVWKGYTGTDGKLPLGSIPGRTFKVRVAYPNTSDRSVGEAEGEITTEGVPVTIPVDVPGVGSVSGVLRSRDGIALGSGTRTVALHLGGDTQAYKSTTPDAGGGFAFTNVPVGAFRLRGTVAAGSSEGYWMFSKAERDLAIATHGEPVVGDALASVGALTAPDQVELWRMTAPAGEALDLRLIGWAYGPHTALPRPALDMYGPDGALVVTRTATATEARATFTAVAAGDYVVVVRGAEGGTGGYRLGATQQVEAHVFRPIEGARITGRVTRDADGAGVASLRVRAVRGGTPVGGALTDGGGAYELRVSPGGAFLVEAADAEGVVIGRGPESENTVAPRDLVVPVHEQASVAVRRGAAFVSGASVTFSSDHPTALGEDKARNRTTDANGLASASLPVGQVTAVVTDPLGGTKQVSGALSELVPLSLDVDLGVVPVSLAGTVTARDGATPVPGATVTLASGPATTTDAAGRYAFDDLVAGAETVTVTHTSAVASRTFTGSASLTLVAGPNERGLALPMAVLRGTVTDSGGPALSGATVAACGNTYASPTAPGVTTCVQATTDADGAYLFLGTPPWGRRSATDARSEWVSLTASASSRQKSASFTYHDNTTATVTSDLAIPIPRYVKVRVIDSFDEPVEGVWVQLYAVSWGWEYGTTDADGRYAFAAAFPAGTAVSVDVSTTEGLAGQAGGTVVAGSDLDLSVQLRSARLRLRLEDESGTPVEGAVEVTALQQPYSWDGGGSETTWTVTASATGEVDVRVPFGFFRVVFDDGVAPAGEDGELAEGETRPITLRRGSHVRLSEPLAGDAGTYGGDPSSCPANECYRFADVQASSVPDVARAEILGQGRRSLRAASADLRFETRRYVPPSGRFARTATVITNLGAAAEVYVSSSLRATTDQPGATITASGSGDLDFGPDDSFVVVRPDSGTAFAAVLGGALAAQWADFYPGSCSEGCWGPEVTASYRLTIPAGGTGVLLAYSVFGDAAEIEARARALADLSDPEALAGLTPDEQAAIVNFARPPTGEVAGTVDLAGAAVPRAEVGAVEAAGRLVGFAEAGEDGAFQMALLPGTVSLVAVDPATGRPGRREVTVMAAETVDGSMSLLGDDALGRIRVQATRDGTTLAVAGAVVRLEAEGFSPAWRPRVVLDGSGGGLFEHVPAGPVTVRLEPPFVGPPQVVTVLPGGEVLVTLTVAEWASGVPVDLTGADGVPYVVDGSGAVVGGASDCRPLCEGGVWGGYPSSAQALLKMSGREAAFGPFTIDDAQVTRRVFVPASGRFARVLDVVRNPGPEREVSLYRSLRLRSLSGAPWQVVEEGGSPGSPDARSLVFSESGANGVGLVLGGAGAARPANTWHYVHLEYTEIGEIEVPEEWDVWDEWYVTVPAQGTAILMQFVVLGPDVLRTVRDLASQADAEALAGLTVEERAAIVNFAVPAADVSVHVEDVAGARVAGARVALLGEDGRTILAGTAGADGRAVLRGAPAGEWALVAQDAAGRLGTTTVVVPESGGVETTVILPADAALGSLLVHGVIGTGPATGAAVRLWVDGLSPFWGPTAVFDGSGQALFTAVPPGTVTVRFEPPYHPSPTTVEVTAGQQAEVVVTTAPVGDVLGTVFGGDGETGVPDVPILAFDIASGEVLGQAATDAQGRYSFEEVAAGLGGFRVEATSPLGTATASVAGAFVTPAEALTRDLTLPISVVKGRIVDADGMTPVAGASTYASRTDAAGNVDSTWGTTSDGDGRFAVFEAPLGEFVLHAQDPYGLTAQVAGRLDDVAQAAVADVQLPAHGAVAGVVKAASGALLASGDVALRALGPLFDQWGSVAPDGTYRFERVALGSVLVQARDASGRTRTIRSRLEAAGDTASLDVQLPATGTVTGSVYAPDGATKRLYSSVQIEAVDDNGPLGWWSMWGYAYSGTYAMSGVPAGTVRVSAYSSSYGEPPAFARAAVTAGATATVDVVLGSGVSLPADLTGADGSRATVGATGGLALEWDGAGPAYDGPLGLTIDGDWPGSAWVGGVEEEGREIVVGPVSPAGLRLTRKVYAPESGGFVRTLEVLENPTAAAVTVPVRIEGTFAARRASRLVVGPGDTGGTYAVLDQGASCCHPALAHVFGGAGAALGVASAEYADGREGFAYRWDVTVPAGGTVALLHFGVHGAPEDAAGVEARAQGLAALTDAEALAGLSAEERSRVLNFSIP